VVVGQNEPTDASLLLDERGNGAHARWQDCSQHPFAGPDQFHRRHRLARQHGRSGDRIAQFLHGAGAVGSLDVTGIDRILWPIQPAEALGPDNLTKPDFRPCHQYLRGIGGNPFLHHSGGLVDEAHHAEEGAEAANASYGDA
jgi:hypothetical protein